MIKQVIITKLSKVFDPILLEVVDQSEAHAGHYPAAEAGETHFKVTLVSALFEGQTLVERHQWVHRVLKDEISKIHALSLDLKSSL